MWFWLDIYQQHKYKKGHRRGALGYLQAVGCLVAPRLSQA